MSFNPKVHVAIVAVICMTLYFGIASTSAAVETRCDPSLEADRISMILAKGDARSPELYVPRRYLLPVPNVARKMPSGELWRDQVFIGVEWPSLCPNPEKVKTPLKQDDHDSTFHAVTLSFAQNPHIHRIKPTIDENYDLLGPSNIGLDKYVERKALSPRGILYFRNVEKFPDAPPVMITCPREGPNVLCKLNAELHPNLAITVGMDSSLLSQWKEIIAAYQKLTDALLIKPAQ